MMMQFSSQQLLVLPIILPLAGAALTLLLRKSRLQAISTLIILLLNLTISVALLFDVWGNNRPLTYQVGGWEAPFGITLAGDLLSVTLLTMAQLVLSSGALYSLGAKDKALRSFAYYPFFLALSAGMSGAFLTGDLFNLFVFAELVTLSGAALTAISDDPQGVEAAFKYFFISLFASTFFLLAVGALYVSYGTLNMADLSRQVAASPQEPLLPFAIIILMAAFMVKSAVFPLHFWQPDFHTSSPTPVSAMLSSVVVKLGVYGFLRMTTLLFLPFAEMIQGILILLGILGILYGSFAALGTQNAKRMLAYSTISQVGFILVAIGWGGTAGLIAALVFAFNHSLIKAAMLMLVGSLASRSKVKSTAFETLNGLGHYFPWIGLLFFLGALALAGLPPTSGFINKLLFFRSGIAGYELLTVGLIGLASLLTLVYSIRAFQRLWWNPQPSEETVKKNGDQLLAPGLLILLVLVLGIWPEPLLNLAQATSSWLLEPANYISMVFGG